MGVDGTGKDVKFYGDDPGNYMLWDQSADLLEIRNDYANAGLVLSNTTVGAINSPALNYYRNSASPEDDDVLGITNYIGRNDNNQDVIYARLQSSILAVADGDEIGQFKIGTMSNGALIQDGILVIGQANDTVDITLGAGTTSSTKVTGYFAANNATPAAAPNYTISNLSADRALDCDSTSDAEVADVLGQVITDLIAIGIFQ